MTESATFKPFKVRYEEFSSTSGWIPCENATVCGEVLVIDYGSGARDMIPLHVIRGRIEVRPNEVAA